jgi:hypothetical protein
MRAKRRSRDKPTLAPVPGRRPPANKKDCAALREAFLEKLRQGYSVSKAASAIGMSTTQVWTWRYRDKDFEKHWIDAAHDGIDKLEDEAYRRTHDGCTRPVYQGGVKVGEVQEYSDNLMALLLRRRRRSDLYGNKQLMDVGGEVEHTFTLKIFEHDVGGGEQKS